MEIWMKMPPQSGIILIMIEGELISLKHQPEDRACEGIQCLKRKTKSYHLVLGRLWFYDCAQQIEYAQKRRMTAPQKTPMMRNLNSIKYEQVYKGIYKIFNTKRNTEVGSHL